MSSDENSKESSFEEIYAAKWRNFSIHDFEDIIRLLLDQGFNFLSCKDYWALKNRNSNVQKNVVLRFDVDSKPKKAHALLAILDKYNIKASFFFRLHSNEYNFYSYSVQMLVSTLQSSGHEIGLHSEVMDFAATRNEHPAKIMAKDIEIFKKMCDLEHVGISSHGDFSGLNNLEFWKKNDPTEFGAIYEAYDEDNLELFKKSLYISDSEWLHWKIYKNGELIEKRHRNITKTLVENEKTIYLLMHPETFYEENPFEE